MWACGLATEHAYATSGPWAAHIPVKESSVELKCRLAASADLSSNPSTYLVSLPLILDLQTGDNHLLFSRSAMSNSL